MSHFTVLVIGENPEEQLAPYQENNMGDCPQEHLEFNETETEYLKEYEEETIEKIVMPDGRMLSRYDDEFRVKGTFGTGTGTHEVPEHLEKREVPFKELYPTFEDFMKDYHGYKERDDKTGKYGYWENPNAKWDWYELGGRWTGFFKTKPQVEDAVVGRPGLLTEPAEVGFADQLKKSEIDIEYMREEAARKAMEKYDFAELLVGHLEKNLTWEEVREKFNDKMEEARKFYWEQPRCAVWEAERKKTSSHSLWVGILRLTISMSHARNTSRGPKTVLWLHLRSLRTANGMSVARWDGGHVCPMRRTSTIGTHRFRK